MKYTSQQMNLASVSTSEIERGENLLLGKRLVENRGSKVEIELHSLL